MEDGRRVFGMRARDFPGHDVVKQERSQLLAVIHDSYEAARAQHRLPAEAGYCLGLLDPVSSLAINVTLASSGDKTPDDLQRRSLEGMVVFLTSFFPSLADWEAVHYLLLAGADLLGAACIILKDRAMETTSGHVDSMVWTALKCAAVAAAHPNPDSLVDAWLSLSPGLDHAVTLLAATTTPTAARLRGLADGADAGIDMGKAWELAANRQLGITGGDDDVPFYHHTRSLRRALLDKIHRRYLRALARLPRRELRCRYHRALLAAGSCYGPFSDPESNVVLNTVWYDTVFPARPDQLELDMITSGALGRAACRSLCGLVSFLCTRYGAGLSEHDAIRRLLDADADLHAAGRDAERRGHRPCSSTREAYEATATAAQHPYASAQAAFLDSGFEDDTATLLPAPHELITSEDVLRLTEQLCPVPAPQPAPPTKRGTKLYWAIIRQRRRRFRAEERLAVSLVEAALAELQDDGDGFELHVICGASECIIGPDYMPDSEDVVYHINFLASQQQQQGPPVLFFAECSKKGPATLCRPVDMPPSRASLVRCLYCEKEGGKIIHPASAEFHGRDKEFEEAASGDMSLGMGSEYAGQQMYLHLREDAIYYEEDSDGGSSGDDDHLLALADYDDDM